MGRSGDSVINCCQKDFSSLQGNFPQLVNNRNSFIHLLSQNLSLSDTKYNDLDIKIASQILGLWAGLAKMALGWMGEHWPPPVAGGCPFRGQDSLARQWAKYCNVLLTFSYEFSQFLFASVYSKVCSSYIANDTQEAKTFFRLPSFSNYVRPSHPDS